MVSGAQELDFEFETGEVVSFLWNVVWRTLGFEDVSAIG
jgi:hypothetical protein